jgi:hypothetical protein
MLRDVGWFVTDVSGQRIGPLFKDQDAKEEASRKSPPLVVCLVWLAGNAPALPGATFSLHPPTSGTNGVRSPEQDTPLRRHYIPTGYSAHTAKGPVLEQSDQSVK